MRIRGPYLVRLCRRPSSVGLIVSLFDLYEFHLFHADPAARKAWSELDEAERVYEAKWRLGAFPRNSEHPVVPWMFPRAFCEARQCLFVGHDLTNASDKERKGWRYTVDGFSYKALDEARREGPPTAHWCVECLKRAGQRSRGHGLHPTAPELRVGKP